MAGHEAMIKNLDLPEPVRHSQKDELLATDYALKRLASGTYGWCIDCRQSIPEKRLEASPTAKRCLDCQKQAEIGRR